MFLGKLESFVMPTNRAGKKKGQTKGFALVSYTEGKPARRLLKQNGVKLGAEVLQFPVSVL